MTAEAQKIRSVVTPEGIALPFEIASPLDRLSAFFVDFMLIHIVVVALVLLGGIATGSGGHGMAIAMLASFFLRTFYFTFFEIRWGGSTIGKRQLNLRVISREGGPVTSESVFARNLTREIEVFLPLAALASPEQLLSGLPAWAAVIGTVWLVLFGLMPLFGRDHLRVGDILGGTMVVRMPKAKLRHDLAESEGLNLEREDEPLEFTRQQLDMYGIKELQILEELLRRSGGHQEMEVVLAVAERIKKKISWPQEQWGVDDWIFLTTFYKAQRARLEHKMLFGKRQREKRK